MLRFRCAAGVCLLLPAMAGADLSAPDKASPGPGGFVKAVS